MTLEYRESRVGFKGLNKNLEAQLKYSNMRKEYILI